MALKDEMPQVATWVAEVRAAFCATQDDLASFNAGIRAGLDGQPGFWARENGRTVGTLDRRQGVSPTPPLKIAQAPEDAAKRWRT